MEPRHDDRRGKIKIRNDVIMDIKKDFPIFQNQNSLIYFDNASTTQKPQCVIDSMVNYYTQYNANVHRGAYNIAEKSTLEFENSRSIVADFINANTKEIIFTKGTTESINLIAYTFGSQLNEGDEIIISEMEHHSNIIPWQMLKEEKNITLKYIPICDNGELDINQLTALINNKTKLISIIHISNILGTINPINKISRIAKKYNIPLLIDAAQSIAHDKIDVQDINCDFLAFSGHKLMGPTGVGVLYINNKFINKLKPFLRGGHMIREVGYESSTWNDTPWKFEAGTANIAQVIGLASSIKYIQKIGIENIKEHTHNLQKHLLNKLKNINEIEIYGHKNGNFGPIISFNIKGCHPYDIAKLLDKYNICIRAGHHCGQILMKKLKINYTNRVSLYYYNSKDEIDIFINSLNKVIDVLKN